MTDRVLHPCPACNRHVADEPACPFCGAQLSAPPLSSTTLPGRFSRAAVFAGATLAGCMANSNEPRTTPHDRDATKYETKCDKLPAADRLGCIEGRVIDTASGQPAFNIEIHLTNAATHDDRRLTTGGDGYYMFDHVEPGSYELTWGTDNPRESRSRLDTTVAEGGRVKLDLTMTSPTPRHSNIPMPYGAPPARYRVV